MKFKRFFSLLFVGIITILLAGCGKNTTTTKQTTTKKTVNYMGEKIKEAPVYPENSPVAKHGLLSVKGAKMVDENGKDFQILGVSTYMLASSYLYVNDALLTQLRDEKHVNCIRLAMYTEANDWAYCSSDGKYAEFNYMYIQQGIECAARNGMYVLVDWHILADRTPQKYKTQALDFFDRISFIYQNYTNVIYELCNEPNDEPIHNIKTTWEEIKEYAEEVITVIRNNGVKNICVVGNPDYSSRPDYAIDNPITMDKNVMYTLHFYAGNHTDKSCLNRAIQAGVPVFVTEFNITQDSGNGKYSVESGNAWMEVLDANKIGYCIWSLGAQNETSALLNFGTPGFKNFTEDDWSDTAKWYWDHIAKVYQNNDK